MPTTFPTSPSSNINDAITSTTSSSPTILTATTTTISALTMSSIILPINNDDLDPIYIIIFVLAVLLCYIVIGTIWCLRHSRRAHRQLSIKYNETESQLKTLKMEQKSYNKTEYI